MITNNVIPLNALSERPALPNDILDNTPRTLRVAVVVGFDENGSFYFASSQCDSSEIMLGFEIAKKILLDELTLTEQER